MTELARGTIADRPWGRTLGALGLRGLTGQLSLVAEGKRYEIAFHGGAIIGATSPLGTDAAVRVALTGNLISSSQVAEISRKLAAAPGRDEIDVVAEHAKLTPDQALRLRRRIVAQRAARTFSVERGEFVVDDTVTIAVVAGTEMDIRAVIYLGARQNLSEARLAVEIGQIGNWFQLKQEAVEDLAQFGFSEAERPILERLLVGGDLAHLEASAPGIEQRMVRAVVYALVSCGTCELAPPHQRTRTSTPPPLAPTTVPVRSSGQTSPPVTSRTTTPRRPRPPTNTPTSREAELDAATIARPRKKSPSRDPESIALQTTAIKELIASRVKQLDRLDHFALLDVSQSATPAEIRKAYFALARQLHPDKLAALGITDGDHGAHRLFARINTAFAVLDNAQLRREYLDILSRGGEAAVRAEQAKAEELAMRALEAENAYRRGEMALRRDQLTTALAEFKKALELDPETSDYQAMVAWTQFCASPDKMGAAKATRAALEKAIATSPRAVTAYVVLGRVERMLGRDADAQRHFQKVLTLSPGHADASMELRVIEARLAQPPKR